MHSCTEMYMYLNLYIVLQEGKLSPEKGESPKKHIPTIKAPSLSSANQIRIVPSVPRAMRKRSGAQEVTPEVFTSPVQQPKTDRFKIIPPKPKSSARTEKSRPEVKPPEVEELEMETGSEETVVTIEVNLDSVDENEAEDSDSLEENDQKVFITARKRSLRRLCLYTCLSVILFIGGVPASVHAGIHPPEQTPPRQAPPPCAMHAGRYGQQAGGTHPTGMHTCWLYFYNKTATDLFTSDDFSVDQIIHTEDLTSGLCLRK